MSDTTPGEAGWQPDPTGKHDHRYWDGSQWTDNVSDAGVASTDPYAAAAEPPASPPTLPPDTAPTDPTVANPVAAVPPTDPTASFGAGGPPPPTPAPVAAADGNGGGGSKKGLLIGGAILAIVAIIVAVLAMGGDDDNKSNIDVDNSTTTIAPSDEDTTTTESSGDTSGSTDAGIDYSDYKDLLAEQLRNAGLDDDQADCLADRMIEAIQSGDLSEADAFSSFQEFFSDCDINPADIGN